MTKCPTQGLPHGVRFTRDPCTLVLSWSCNSHASLINLVPTVIIMILRAMALIMKYTAQSYSYALFCIGNRVLGHSIWYTSPLFLPVLFYFFLQKSEKRAVQLHCIALYKQSQNCTIGVVSLWGPTSVWCTGLCTQHSLQETQIMSNVSGAERRQP